MRATAANGSSAGAALVPVFGFLLAVAFSPSVSVPAWTPRAAVVLVATAVGLPLLVRLWRSPARAPAIAASAFVAVAALSTVLSDEPGRALSGAFGWGTGLLFVAALAASWAIGVTASALARRRLEAAVALGLCVNLTVAAVQLTLDPGIDELRLFEGRATGLLGNPVHLAALSVGVFALAAARFDAGRWPRRWAAMAAAAAAGAQVSGTRFALVVIAVVVLAPAVRRPRAWRAVALIGAAAVGGIALGSAVTAIGGGVSGTERAVEGVSGSGLEARLDTWWDARHAVAHAPFLGAGPGRFRAATSADRSLATARANIPDQLYADGHNLVVEYAVTTGLIGLAALAVWLALAIGGAAGPLLAFALAVLGLQLVQPQMVATTPLALLALGAASRQTAATTATLPGRQAGAIATLALAIPALVAAGALLAGDFHLDQARLDFDLAQAREARRLLPWWPEPYELTGRIEAFRSIDLRDPAALERARDWHERAVARDPTSSLQWSELAEVELALGDADAAVRDFSHALEHDPWSVRASIGKARALVALGRTDEAILLVQRAIDVADTPSARALLRELQNAL